MLVKLMAVFAGIDSPDFWYKPSSEINGNDLKGSVLGELSGENSNSV
jgi:hypothetical protein